MKKISAQKVTYLPGWAELPSFQSAFEGLDIWYEDIDFRKKIETKYLVGNSLGCHFTLLNWNENRNTKLILVNPLIEKKPMLFWALRWIGFIVWESWRNYTNQKMENFWKMNKLAMIKKARNFLNRSYWEILERIPKEDVLIVKGSKDYYFCDRGLARKIKRKGINLLEVPGMGHVWKKEHLRYIEKFIV